jgi:hypothetical protein
MVNPLQVRQEGWHLLQTPEFRYRAPAQAVQKMALVHSMQKLEHLLQPDPVMNDTPNAQEAQALASEVQV